MLSDSLGETFKIALETAGLVSAGWVTHEVVVSGSSEETVRVGTAALVSAPELGTSEVAVSGPLLKIDEVVMGTTVLVSAPELGTSEVAVSGPPLKIDEVVMGTTVLVSAPELGTSEGVVSGPLLKIDGVVMGTTVLVSSPDLVVKEAVIFGLSGVVMIVPIVLVLAFLSDVLRRGSIPEVGVDTLVVTVVFRAVAVVSVLSVPLVDNPVKCRMDTKLGQHYYSLLGWQLLILSPCQERERNVSAWYVLRSFWNGKMPSPYLGFPRWC